MLLSNRQIGNMNNKKNNNNKKYNTINKRNL